MRKLLVIIFSLIILAVWVQALEINSASYNMNSNVLSLSLNTPVQTYEVRLGRLTFHDNDGSLTLTGGAITTVDTLSSQIDISMIYSTVVDERANADVGTSSNWPTFKYWGATRQLVDALESMDLNNLTLDAEVGTFVDEANNPNDAVIGLPVQVTNQDDNSPIPESAVYDMNTNQLEINFDRLVQFDTIAEDRTCSNGQEVCPGNGALDGGPSEDGEDVYNGITFGNNNGVLDMEVNIDVFRIGFSSSSGYMTLEGIRGILETEDSNSITLLLTRANAKKLETSVFDDDVQLAINSGAFVDQNYNPNTAVSLSFDIVEEELPLELTSATYVLDENKFELEFADSRDVTATTPTPVFSKIAISDGTNEFALRGVDKVSALGTTLLLKELLLMDQSAVEQLIYDAQETESPLFINVQEYAIYDANGNGNMAAGIPLVVTGSYENPVLDSISYSSTDNRLILDWSPDLVVYYLYDRISTTKTSFPLTGFTITDLTTGNPYSVGDVQIYRNMAKTETYVEFAESDAGWIENVGNLGHSLQIEIAPYTFYTSGNTDNNGNLLESQTVDYTADATGPSITSVRIDETDKSITIEFDKNVLSNTINIGSINLTVNGQSLTLNNLTLHELPYYSDVVTLTIPDADFNSLISLIPENQIIQIFMELLTEDSVFNADGVTGEPFFDLNNNGQWDDAPEPLDDFGSDGIADEDEAGYPGSCTVEGFCSDPAYDNQTDCESAFSCSDPQYNTEEDCLGFDGTCTNHHYHNQSDCESHGFVWTPDNAWQPETWTLYSGQDECEGAGAVWIENLDPAGDDYDETTNPAGTEGNGVLDEGESFTDAYPNGVWDLFEPTTIEVNFGRYLWNESHRAFATSPELKYFSKKMETSDFVFMVEENAWSGYCKNEEDEAVYEDATTVAACSDLPDNSANTPAWVQTTSSDLTQLSEFLSANISGLQERHGNLVDIDGNGKIIIAFYDIIDEYSKGSNDTNSSLITQGYYHISETAGPTTNAGDIIYLDNSPQYVYSGDGDIPDTGTMKNALVHEMTKLLIDENEPDEEVWLREGLAYFEQLRILGETKFFGDNTNPSVTAQNQLTFISFSKKNRTDQYNIYLFLNYLFEKYTNTDGWDIIDAIAGNTTSPGLASVEESLHTIGFTDANVKDIFIDYATACFLDMDQDLGVYNGKYRFDAVDLYGAPSGKNAGVWKFTEDSPPPYSVKNIQPWSFSYFLIEGLSVSMIDNSITVKSPMITADNNLVIDGYNGIDFRAKKIVLRNGFIQAMDPLFEVVDFDMDTVSGIGSLPVTTNSITVNDSTYDFAFKSYHGECSDGVSGTEEECCTDSGGTWDGVCSDGTATWTWFGNQNMAIVVAKVDDAQPPITYDFVVTTVDSPQEFSDFYVIQNKGILNYLDLFVISQRPIFSESGVEGPEISVRSIYDTTAVLLAATPIATENYVLYHNVWQLGIWSDYTLNYSGSDQNGIPVTPVNIDISTAYTLNRRGGDFELSDGLARLSIPSDYEQNIRLTAMTCSRLGKNGVPAFDLDGIDSVTEPIFFGPSGVKLEEPLKLTLQLPADLDVILKIYSFREGNWINIGGSRVENSVQANIDELGYFVLASGNHLPEHSLGNIPESFTLNQNYPNPFNAGTMIRYYLPDEGTVSLKIYNIRGQYVTTLVNEFQSANWYSINWDALDNRGLAIPSGVYFMKLEADGLIKTQKMVLMK